MTPIARPTLVVSLCLALATAALAHSGVRNHAVMTRMEAMLSSKKAIERLVAMVKGQSAFDAAAADTAQQALMAHMKATPDLFRDPQSDPKSEALPLIWDTWADFERKSNSAYLAVAALDTQSLEGLRGTLLRVGNTCLDCHQTYRKEKH